LVRLTVAEGAHALDEGDWPGSLAWFAEALRLDPGDPGRERMYRTRFAAVLRRCPRLLLLSFHDGPVWQAQFSPDGGLVVLAADDWTARVWDAGTGEPITPALRFNELIEHAAFAGDGETVRLAGTARTEWVVDLHRDDRPTTDLLDLAWLLSGTRIDPARGPLPLEADVLERTWRRMRDRYPDEFAPLSKVPRPDK
jgi:hypothetical protein